MDSREPREDHELADLRQMILDFEDFINTPPQYEELRRVCEYRNELYRHWEPLARAILSDLRRPSPVAESTPTDATAVEAERDGDKCACFCPTDECQRVCTLDCLNAGARIPPRQADMADAQKAESTPSPDTEGVRLAVRPEVAAFALLMERELRANDHKPGWKNDTPTALADRARDEAAELREVVGQLDRQIIWAPYPDARANGWHRKNPDTGLREVGVGYAPAEGGLRAELEQRAASEAADVANMAMMVADVCGALKSSPTAQNTGRDEVLEALAHHRNWELSYGYEDEEEPGAWQVHSVNGGRNDREWTLIGAGDTPREALSAALKSSPPVSTVDEEGGGA